MLCEQCGNDFYTKHIIKKDDKDYIKCPYCNYLNKRVYRNNKKKRGVQNESNIKRRNTY